MNKIIVIVLVVLVSVTTGKSGNKTGKNFQLLFGVGCKTCNKTLEFLLPSNIYDAYDRVDSFVNMTLCQFMPSDVEYNCMTAITTPVKISYLLTYNIFNRYRLFYCSLWC